ncbi:MAG: hydrogenase maturation nickel metallochaperone HypA [Nitrospirae bacterium CG_4_9_14_3_um_filter_53_35]|nr:MAG: hydrogenase maturation nickel metallochaperone HypA [Nitrospirae bacterium CG08_land_8_20_14_0_20_52_24]PIV85436.1 MAG: hydrogenase maturation nickel metallochaperone HypA [Nitrospirae bacterium CG17_big_fil_post_rev_8_21_14_2_50_50_9]PIW85072.1 MAG: hydrogenase maturation nickel metallochaperone HypA [Nitrospirae bacterium CG_4_8_14_3_um_filter_50_41]PIX85532.1 MAG: hydrogenase maturation nickel metallochaperone HypA [Nitrospirae bacterium CG_4_10_14_3_um_filter_53_41]PJA72776.1 MAG: h
MIVHELSVAMNMIEMAESACVEQGYSRVEAVSIRVGRASGIMRDALVFAFDCAKAGTLAADARLDIEDVPVGGACNDCHAEFSVEEAFVFNCPACGGKSFQITSGQELHIVELEVDS